MRVSFPELFFLSFFLTPSLDFLFPLLSWTAVGPTHISVKRGNERFPTPDDIAQPRHWAGCGQLSTGHLWWRLSRNLNLLRLLQSVYSYFASMSSCWGMGTCVRLDSAAETVMVSFVLIWSESKDGSPISSASPRFFIWHRCISFSLHLIVVSFGDGFDQKILCFLFDCNFVGTAKRCSTRLSISPH